MIYIIVTLITLFFIGIEHELIDETFETIRDCLDFEGNLIKKVIIIILSIIITILYLHIVSPLKIAFKLGKRIAYFLDTEE